MSDDQKNYSAGLTVGDALVGTASTTAVLLFFSNEKATDLSDGIAAAKRTLALTKTDGAKDIADASALAKRSPKYGTHYKNKIENQYRTNILQQTKNLKDAENRTLLVEMGAILPTVAILAGTMAAYTWKMFKNNMAQKKNPENATLSQLKR